MKKKEIYIPSCIHCKNSKGLLCSLSERDKQIISDEKCDNFYQKGEIIFKEGSRPNRLFCLYEGKVKLVKSGKDGKEQIVRLSKEGDILGYRSLLSSEPYQATAIALEDSYICNIDKNKFIQIIQSNPALSLEVIQLLSNDLKSAEQRIVDINQKTVKERVSEALLLLIHTFGYLLDGETLNIKMTRSEIAEMAGTTTESAIRTLSLLHEEKVITLNRKHIVISNLKQLIRCTNTYD